MQWLAFVIIGLGIGTLAGLSVSPVLSIILTSLVATAATLTAVLGGYQQNDTPKTKHPVNALPLAVLVFSIMAGGALGMYTRISLSRRLGADVRAEALRPPSSQQMQTILQEWADLGQDENVVKSKVFEIYMGSAATTLSSQAEQSLPATQAVLYSAAVTVDECQRMENALADELRNTMRRSGSTELREIATLVDDPVVLRLITEVVCYED